MSKVRFPHRKGRLKISHTEIGNYYWWECDRQNCKLPTKSVVLCFCFPLAKSWAQFSPPSAGPLVDQEPLSPSCSCLTQMLDLDQCHLGPVYGSSLTFTIHGNLNLSSKCGFILSLLANVLCVVRGTTAGRRSRVTGDTGVSSCSVVLQNSSHIFNNLHVLKQNCIFMGFSVHATHIPGRGIPPRWLLLRLLPFFFMPLRVFCFLFAGAGGRGVLRIWI